MKSDPRGCDYAASRANITLRHAGMAEENGQCERQVVAMFWDFGLAVSSQQQSAGDHV